MRKIFTILGIIMIAVIGYSQNGALTISDNGNVILMGNVNAIVAQPSNQGIRKIGTLTGGILADDEQSRIVWLMHTNIGNYVIPFKTNESEQIPVYVDKTTVGTSASTGKLIVSTYHTAVNNTPYPTNSDTWFSDVTNMNLCNPACADNSANVVNRFWPIMFDGYSVNPSINITLSYDKTGATSDLGAIPEAQLQAQYWNGTIWILPPVGVVQIASSYVEQINNVNFSAPWVLTNKTFPLPVTMLSFDITCDNNGRNIVFKTASENNSNHFVLQSSEDGMFFSNITIVAGANNSNSITTYTVADTNTYSSNIVYYQILQVDNDGQSHTYGLYSSTCDVLSNIIMIYPNPSHINNDIFVTGNVKTVKVYSIIGAEVHYELIDNYIVHGLAQGMYLLVVNDTYSFRVIVN